MRDQSLSFHGLPVSLEVQMIQQNEEGSGRFEPSVSSPGEQTSENKTVLVVDDVADVTEMLSVFLAQAGYSVVTASSAAQALSVAQNQHFDVIISDIGMPNMNGYQLARALRSMPEYSHVAMVAVTGYSMFDDRERSMSAGFNAHLTKPIDPCELLDVIEQL